MTKLAIAVRQDRCIGCNTCTLACKMQNNVPDHMLWNRVLTEGCELFDGAEGTYPQLSRSYLPLACQHCENPACLAVCPVQATYQDELGRVLIDYDTCIGCQACQSACPYGVRVFNEAEPVRATGFDYGDAAPRKQGVMEKCTLCKERTNEGLEPMCVACCPADARVFGDLDDPESAISRLRAREDAHLLLEEEGTQPHVFYVGR